ncbi:MAG: stage II sporulation protein P, partial [Firmicutes bacterium]|nr:stage II sporulation protein P [Bacillota bacterium]
MTATINFELGGDQTADQVTLSPQPSEAVSAAPEATGALPGAVPRISIVTPRPSVTLPSTPTPSAEVSPEASPTLGTIIPTTIQGGLTIKNNTSADVDMAALMAEPLTQTLPKDGPQILIIHTHGSEAYTPDGTDNYESSGDNRTEDRNYSVIRVGDELTAALTRYGLNVIHDRGIYDYPSYSGSYTKSGAAVESYLSEYPNIAVVIDLHRDALGDGDTIYKTVAEESGQPSSQLMLLVGTGENGLPFPQWKENLKLALYLQAAVSAKYPTLARPIDLVPERYNQQLTTGSLILEVGSSGNTLQEALQAVRLFADAVGEPLKK